METKYNDQTTNDKQLQTIGYYNLKIGACNL